VQLNRRIDYENSIWDTCNDTDGTPCDDTVLTWLHTLDRDWLEFVTNLLLGRLATFVIFFDWFPEM
jgi:hypothetical protein